MDKYILQMKGITKTFPGVKALDNVTVEILSGEIHGLIGENGAGKSTLMKVLMGIYKADEGEILVEGQSVKIGNPTEAIKLGIGMVPQELNLNPFVTAAENIFLGNEMKTGGRINWKKTNEEAVKVMKSIGLDINPTTIVSRLSSAQQQLVQLSRVLATGAKILVFDEPTASLTTAEVKTLLALMKKLKEEGKTIVFITHHLDELLSTTDRITVMRDGKMVSVDDTSSIDEATLIEKMAGKKMAKQTRVNREVKKDEVLRVEHFTRTKEFEDINFSVNRGEIFGIGGLVGAGRSELISAIFGRTRPENGKLYLYGKETVITSPSDGVKQGMGYLPEERRAHGIFPILSVQENMVIPMYKKIMKAGKIDYSNAKKITNDYIERIQIKTPSVDTPIKSLSGGNQQKVILARWLAEGAKIIFMDEPTRGIDVNAKAEIYDLIRQMTAAGVTVIVVSSEHEELMLLCDRIMIIHEGKQKGILDAKSINTSQDILEIALGDGGKNE